MIPIDFKVTCSKVKVKPLFWAQCVFRSISFDPFTWSIPNSVQWLRPIIRWFLSIFRSHVQRSRLNHSFEPSVLSTLYILIPCTLASDWFCFYRDLHHWGHICFWNISCSMIFLFFSLIIIMYCLFCKDMPFKHNYKNSFESLQISP